MQSFNIYKTTDAYYDSDTLIILDIQPPFIRGIGSKQNSCV